MNVIEQAIEQLEADGHYELAASLKIQFESLKAITELAVEKFELILRHTPLGSASFNVAVSALSEIEKIQNG